MKKNITIILAIIIVMIIAIIIIKQKPQVASAPVVNISSSDTTQATTPPTPAPGTSTYVDPNGRFSFSYNSNFVTDSTATNSTNWKANSMTQGTLLGTLTIPKSYMPSTNFSEAKLTVGKSNDKSAVKSCLTDEGYTDTHVTKNIGGIPFHQLSFGDAGAGNLYETTSYRALINGDCYAVEYTIHSTNIGNYSPDQGITQFDRAKVTNELESIINSFKFLK